MSQITLITLLHGVFFLLFVAILYKTVVLRRKKKILLQQLNETSSSLQKLKEELQNLQTENNRIKQFQDSLATAELTTRLQKPRLNVQSSHENNCPPEKYRLVRFLTEKKMSIDEIASFLSISHHEAQQLVTLSKLAR